MNTTFLAGIGQVNDDLSENFVVVNQSTDDFVLELKFLDILERPDIGLVLITREAADKILTLINMHKGVNPTVMVIDCRICCKKMLTVRFSFRLYPDIMGRSKLTYL